jgi:hypothetical protein
VVRIFNSSRFAWFRFFAGKVGTLGLTVLPDNDSGSNHGSGRELAKLQLGNSVLPGCLLGGDGGLDSVEQPLEPADKLRLRNPELSVGRGRIFREREADTFQLLH